MSLLKGGGWGADSFTPEDRQVSSVVATGHSGERGHINRELPTAAASSSGTPGGDRNSQRLSHPGAVGQARASSRNCRRWTPKRTRLLPLQASPVRVPGPGVRLQPLPDRFPPQPRPSPHSPPRAAFRPAGSSQEVKRHVRSRPADGSRRAAATVEMLLPPSLYSRLAGAPGAAEPLPVERNPAAGAAPFRFTPRPVHFPRDHEFFEVRENLGGRFPEPPTHRAGPRGRDCGCGRG